MATETLRNSSILEIIGNTGVTVESKTINSGFTSERKQITLSGRVELEKATTIGTLKLTAAENKRFLKSPGIELKSSSRTFNIGSNLKIKLKSTEKDTNGNTTVYLYDLIYTGKENISKISKLKYILSNETIGIISKVTGIDRVEFGKSIIGRDGEKRKITIHGTPYASFKLSINKITEAIDLNSGRDVLINSFESSILADYVANSTTTDGKYTIKDSKLNSKGIYTFDQDFPRLEADADDATRYTTLGKYSINILPTTAKSKFTGWIKDRIANDYNWYGWYTKILTQKFKAVVKLQATANNVLYTINRQVIAGGASTQTHNLTFSSNKEEHHIKYILRPVSSSHAFASILGRAASYSKVGGTTDWTNTTITSNGGTDVDISNISLALSTTKISNDTATFSFTAKVNERGYKDVTMAIALNTLVSCS